jgi:hypothetical protein
MKQLLTPLFLEGRRRHWPLALLASSLVGCAASDFDDLIKPTHQGREPISCDAGFDATVDGLAECMSVDSDASATSVEAGRGGGSGEDMQTPVVDPETGSPVPTDASMPDWSAPDALVPGADTGVPVSPDASTNDSGVRDAGARDAGRDAGPVKPCGGATPACTGGQIGREMEPCGNCGSGVRTRTRTCSADGCSWGAWSAWSACTGQSGCTPGDTQACSPADSCGNRVCTNSCTWSGCQPKAGAACLRRRNMEQEEGSNYRCCADSRWQFCQPSCQWSTGCDTCSAQFCEC